MCVFLCMDVMRKEDDNQEEDRPVSVGEKEEVGRRIRERRGDDRFCVCFCVCMCLFYYKRMHVLIVKVSV